MKRGTQHKADMGAHEAAKKGDIESLKASIAEGTDLTELDGKKESPLHWCVLFEWVQEC